MLRKPKTTDKPADLSLPQITPELLNELVSGPMTAESLGAMFRQLKKTVIERAMSADLTYRQGYPAGAARPDCQENQRNGTSPKTILLDEGPLVLDLPRDRNGSFEPQLIPRHQRRFAGFDEKIIALYARGLTMREIQKHLHELYAVEVSPALISEVTNAVISYAPSPRPKPLAPTAPPAPPRSVTS